jgi:DNA repair exonuclease SbcCD nuclease subunit
MRFLHLADVHLDTPFAGRSPALRSRLRSASREAFSAAVACALGEGVDALLIAGDLFDGERLSFGSEVFLLEQLGRLREGGVPVVYATGNHDPGTRARRPLPWPDNVTVVEDPRPRRVAIRRPGGETVGFVTAAGHASARETADLSRAFPPPREEHPEVALLHTQVGGARSGDEHHAYAPSELLSLIASGYHYWALGHIHLRQCLSESPAVHYPGNVQGRTARERGPKGGLLVDLARPDAPRVEFRAFAPVRFETLEVRGLEAEGNVSALVERVARAWGDARRAEGVSAEWVLRVVLSGPTPLARELEEPDDRAALARELEDALGVLDVDVWTRGTHTPPVVGDHKGRQDLLGEALRLLEDVTSGRADLPALRADELAAPEARDDVAAYARTLLAGSDGELLARLLASGER